MSSYALRDHILSYMVKALPDAVRERLAGSVNDTELLVMLKDFVETERQDRLRTRWSDLRTCSAEELRRSLAATAGNTDSERYGQLLQAVRNPHCDNPEALIREGRDLLSAVSRKAFPWRFALTADKVFEIWADERLSPQILTEAVDEYLAGTADNHKLLAWRMFASALLLNPSVPPAKHAELKKFVDGMASMVTQGPYFEAYLAVARPKGRVTLDDLVKIASLAGGDLKPFPWGDVEPCIPQLTTEELISLVTTPALEKNPTFVQIVQNELLRRDDADGDTLISLRDNDDRLDLLLLHRNISAKNLYASGGDEGLVAAAALVHPDLTWEQRKTLLDNLDEDGLLSITTATLHIDQFNDWIDQSHPDLAGFPVEWQIHALSKRAAV